MDNSDSLRRQLEISQTTLNALREQESRYPPSAATRAANEHRRGQNKISRLQSQLAQRHGAPPKSLAINLPRRETFVGRQLLSARPVHARIVALRSELGSVDRWHGWDGKDGLGERSRSYRPRSGHVRRISLASPTTSLTIDGVSEEALRVSSLDAFVRTFANELGYGDNVGCIPDSDERETVFLDKLRGRQTLLIFDNLETLPDLERARINAFLDRLPAPNKAIVTSRHRVGVRASVIRLEQLTYVEAYQLVNHG